MSPADRSSGSAPLPRAGDPPASVAAPAATLPPPTPASLADLPKPWLLKLAGADSFKGHSTTLWSLSRTCSLFRDLVLRQRGAKASFNVPVAAEDFPRQLQCLCTLARHSHHIKLAFRGSPEPLPWTAAEPHVAHLLLCAMAQLGGQPLTAVNEIEFYSLEQTSLVPVWLPLTCPNVTTLECEGGTITQHFPLPAPPPPATTTSPAPVHLKHVTWSGWWQPEAQAQGLARHLQQQLAALPSLTSLALHDLETWSLVAELHSTSVTRLRFVSGDLEDKVACNGALQRLPAQFPNLVELDAPHCLTLHDDGLEALLSLRSLRRVHVFELDLERSHANRPCAWEELWLQSCSVDSAARLPLEGIQRLGAHTHEVHPSRDAQAVARVAAAIQRSGALCWDGLDVSGFNTTALFTTLRPLVEALPAGGQRWVGIRGLSALSPDVLRQLGQQLTPAVHTLIFADCTLPREVSPALLPSLPATVARVELCWLAPWRYGPPSSEGFEERVLAMCSAAVRPITVCVGRELMPEEALARVRARLAEQGNAHVTLVG